MIWTTILRKELALHHWHLKQFSSYSRHWGVRWAKMDHSTSGKHFFLLVKFKGEVDVLRCFTFQSYILLCWDAYPISFAGENFSTQIAHLKGLKYNSPLHILHYHRICWSSYNFKIPDKIVYCSFCIEGVDCPFWQETNVKLSLLSCLSWLASTLWACTSMLQDATVRCWRRFNCLYTHPEINT